VKATKVGVASFASEKVFDPVGLTKLEGKPESCCEVKHGRYSLMAASAVAAALAAPGVARADEIGDAAAKLSKAAYPFMKEVPWNSNLYNIKPGSADAVSWAKAIGKMIDMGASMDPRLVQAGAKAHHDAIQGLPANGVASEAKLTAIYAAIGRMIASVPESKTMGVYDAVGGLVDAKVPAYLMSTVKEQDAKAAYAALVEFANVVKAHPITTAAPSTVTWGSSIDAAASKFAAAAYPLIKDVDWTSDLFSKPIPGQSPQDVLKAVDKMILMGAAMDGAALQTAAKAHVKAIDGMDAKGVLSAGDFEAISAGLGKAIASVPTATVMDVYNSMGKLIGSSPVPNYLYSLVKPEDAQAAYNALLEFKDVVKTTKVGVASFASEKVFDPVGLTKLDGKPESCCEVKHAP
jgi:hypothetical protein